MGAGSRRKWKAKGKQHSWQGQSSTVGKGEAGESARTKQWSRQGRSRGVGKGESVELARESDRKRLAKQHDL